MNCAKSCNRFAGNAPCSDLAIAISPCMASSRRRGSGSSVGSTATMADTRFPPAPASLSSRTDTGTMARSGRSGNESWSISQRRSAPAHNVITTSFTVPPSSFFTALIASIGSDPNANRRCGEITPLNTVRGACTDGRDKTSSRLLTPGALSAKLRMIVPSAGTVWRASRIPTRGWVIAPNTPRANISRELGSRSHCHGVVGGGVGAGSGSTSKRTPRISAPATPSIQEWWILVSSAKKPPSRPSMMYISQRGRDRSRWRAAMRTANSAS